MNSAVRRAAAIPTIAFGIWLLVFPFAFSIFDRTQSAERVTDRFRPVLSEQGVTALKGNYGTIRGLGVQFIGETRPDLAKKLGMTQPQFDAYLAKNFPASARGVRELPAAVGLVDPVIPQLDRVSASGDFDSVDGLPGLGLPIDSLPWILLGLGVLVTGVGVVALRTGGRVATLAGAGVCAAIVVGAFAFSLPSKFRATDRIDPVGRVALSQRAADTATSTVATVDAMVPEVQTRMIPLLATRLGTTPNELSTQLAADYPAVGKGLATWPQIKPGAADLASRQRASVGDFAAGDGAPFRTLPWLIIVPSLLCALLGGAAVLKRPARLRRVVTHPAR